MVLRLNWLAVLILSLFISFQTLLAKEVSAEPKITFSKQKIQIGAKKITVEVAKTKEQHERGLMFRPSLAKDSGMLFIFDDEQPLSFWMKNTIIDLSIAYIGKDKKIVDILEMKATSSLDRDIPSYPSTRPAMYALEMTKGWFDQHKIKVGDALNLAP